MTTEILLGRNFNSFEGDTVTLDQDLHSCDGGTTDVMVVYVPSGTYKVTRTSGRAPGQVSYYGHAVEAMTETTTSSTIIYGVLLDTLNLVEQFAALETSKNDGRVLNLSDLDRAVRVVEFASRIEDGATCFRTLHDLYALIGCDLVEHVSTFEPTFDMWVDEEGMICPKTVDTELGEMATVTEFHGVDLQLWGRIVFTGAGDGEGGTLPQTREWAETLRDNILSAMATGAIRVAAVDRTNG